MPMTRPPYSSGFREQMVEPVRLGPLAGGAGSGVRAVRLSRSATGSTRPTETRVAEMTA